jgi:hypothetical protein
MDMPIVKSIANQGVKQVNIKQPVRNRTAGVLKCNALFLPEKITGVRLLIKVVSKKLSHL